MTIKTQITDPTTSIQAGVVDGDEENALVVATRPLKTFATKTVFFTNPTYGREMAQDGAFGAGALLIHDGTDTVAWTMSEPVGTKWVADSTDRFFADAKSLKDDNSNIGDIVQVINNVGPGNDIDMTGNYVATTFWINVDVDWLAGDSILLYAHLNGVLVGNTVNIQDYFDFDDFDIWHFVNIPLADLGIESSSIDAFRIEIASRAGAKSPKFYIDEWYLQASGTPIAFTVEPDLGTWFHVKNFQAVFVDAYNADNADSTMPHLSYNKFLGMTGTAGYIFKLFQEGKTDPAIEARVTNLMDAMSFSFTEINTVVSDGTNTMMVLTSTLTEETKFILKSEDADKMTVTLEDKFDDLLFFRISVTGFVEQR